MLSSHGNGLHNHRPVMNVTENDTVSRQQQHQRHQSQHHTSHFKVHAHNGDRLIRVRAVHGGANESSSNGPGKDTTVISGDQSDGTETRFEFLRKLNSGPRRNLLPWYPAKVLSALLVFVWTLVLWGAMVVNIQYEGFDVYHKYYTNWTWTLNVFFYTTLLFGYIDFTGTIQYYTLMFLWWPVFFQISEVFWLVFVMVIYNPSVITDAGEKYGFDIVLFVDRVKHVVPFIVAQLWFHLVLKDFKILIADIYSGKHKTRSLVLYIICVVVIGHAFIVGYWIAFDFREIYGVNLNVFVGILLIEAIVLIHVVAPILFYSPLFNVFRNSLFENYSDVSLANPTNSKDVGVTTNDTTGRTNGPDDDDSQRVIPAVVETESDTRSGKLVRTEDEPLMFRLENRDNNGIAADAKVKVIVL